MQPQIFQHRIIAILYVCLIFFSVISASASCNEFRCIVMRSRKLRVDWQKLTIYCRTFTFSQHYLLVPTLGSGFAAVKFIQRIQRKRKRRKRSGERWFETFRARGKKFQGKYTLDREQRDRRFVWNRLSTTLRDRERARVNILAVAQQGGKTSGHWMLNNIQVVRFNFRETLK